jgi:hypothetical protein
MNDRLRALAVLISVFVAGCIIGAAGSFLWTKKAAPNPPRQRGENATYNRETDRARLPDLHLIPEQQARFNEIMAESRKQLDTIRDEQEPKIKAIRDETNRKLFATLNEDQKRQFEQYLKSVQERRNRGPRRGGGNGGGFRPPEPSR